MKRLAKCLAFPVGVAVLLWAGQASAMSIVINIDATVNTDPGFGATPISVVLGAGDYRITPLSHLIPADALLGAIFTAWDNNNASPSWIPQYSYTFASDPAGERRDVGPGASFPTEAAAFANAAGSTFTLAAPETVWFFVGDIGGGDNVAGISLLLTPEPDTALMLGAGLLALGIGGRRRH